MLWTGSFPTWSAPPTLPQLNLRIELRQVDEEQANERSAGTQGVVVSSSGGPPAVAGGVTLSTRRLSSQGQLSQQVQVLNGGRAGLQIGASIPVQWVQAVGVDGASGAPVLSQGVTWLEAGRSLLVQPRWPGGSQPVTVEVQVDQAAVDPNAQWNHNASGLPVQTRAQTVTTVQAPLGEWVTLARSAGEQQASQRGVWSTRSTQAQQRQVLQLRVLGP